MFHLLIVDSEEDLLWALSKNLFKGRSDITIHTAPSGEKALELIRQHRIDLLVADLRVQGEINGFDLILKAKDKASKAKLIIMTPPRARGEKDEEPSLGVMHYISKPFDIARLRTLIANLLEEGEGFRGTMGDLALADILALICLNARTVLLHLHHRGRRGRIEIRDGVFNHAEFDDRKGSEAAWTMLGLKDGDIFMQSDYNPSPRSIDMDWQEFLAQASAWLDEHGPVSYNEPEVDIPVEGWDDDELGGNNDDDDDDLGGALDATNLLGFSAEELEELSGLEDGDLDGGGFPSLGGLTDKEPISRRPSRGKEETLPRAPRLQPANGDSDIFALPPMPQGPNHDGGLSLHQRTPTINRKIPLPERQDRVRPLGEAARSIEEVLNALRDELPSLIAAEVLHVTEGSVIAGVATDHDPSYKPDHEAVAAYYGEVLRAAQRAAVACGEQAALETLLISTDKFYLLARMVPLTSFAQLVTVARDGNLGIAQVYMRRLEPSLTRVLL